MTFGNRYKRVSWAESGTAQGLVRSFDPVGDPGMTQTRRSFDEHSESGNPQGIVTSAWNLRQMVPRLSKGIGMQVP